MNRKITFHKMMWTHCVSFLFFSSYLSFHQIVFSLPIQNDGICASATWNRNGITVAGGRGLGSALKQLNYPNGVFVDDEGTVYVADTNNRRVIKWTPGSTSGEVVVNGDASSSNGKPLGQITKAIVDKQGTIYVCDRDNRRVLRYPKNEKNAETIMNNVSCWGLAMGNERSLYVSDLEDHSVLTWPGNQVVAGGNGKGNALNQLYYPYQIFVDDGETLYIADRGNNRLVQWSAGAREGVLAIQSTGFGNGADQLYKPMSVTVDKMGSVYEVEYINQRVMRWFKGAKSGNVIIGGPGYGSGAAELNFPRDLAFDQQGNLYVADTNNHRIQMYAIDKSSCTPSKSKA